MAGLPRKYDPAVVEVVSDRLASLREAEGAFLRAVDMARGAGVPLRVLADVTGVAESTIWADLRAFWGPG